MNFRYKTDYSKVKNLDCSQGLLTDRNSVFGNNSQISKRIVKNDEKLATMTPFLQKKLNLLAGVRAKLNTSETKKNSNCAGIIITVNKILSQRLLFGLRSLEKLCINPIAFTQCPRCDHVGLSLLTSSTKGKISPKFFQKIVSILPKGAKNEKCKQNKETNNEKNSEKSSFFENNQNFSPFCKKIEKIPSFLDGKSPCFSQNEKQNYSTKSLQKEPSKRILKENNSQKVPLLNLKRGKFKINCKKGLNILLLYTDNRLRWAFELIQSLAYSSIIEYDYADDFESKLGRKYTFGYVEPPESCEISKIEQKNFKIYEDSFFLECPSPNQTQKTAFKILYSRIQKILFRRKLHIFMNFSDLIL